MTRYNTADMTPEEREQLLIKLVPGDVITVRPGEDRGCPCGQCTSDWSEALYANGDRQRGGWCPEQHQLVGIKAGFVSRACPIPELVEGEVHDPGTLRLQPFRTIRMNAPVKAAMEGSRSLGNEVRAQAPSVGGSSVLSPALCHREPVATGDVSVKGGEVLSHLSSTDTSCYKSSPRPHREHVPDKGWFF